MPIPLPGIRFPNDTQGYRQGTIPRIADALGRRKRQQAELDWQSEQQQQQRKEWTHEENERQRQNEEREREERFYSHIGDPQGPRGTYTVEQLSPLRKPYPKLTYELLEDQKKWLKLDKDGRLDELKREKLISETARNRGSGFLMSLGGSNPNLTSEEIVSMLDKRIAKLTASGSQIDMAEARDLERIRTGPDGMPRTDLNSKVLVMSGEGYRGSSKMMAKMFEDEEDSLPPPSSLDRVLGEEPPSPAASTTPPAGSTASTPAPAAGREIPFQEAAIGTMRDTFGKEGTRQIMKENPELKNAIKAGDKAAIKREVLKTPYAQEKSLKRRREVQDFINELTPTPVSKRTSLGLRAM